MPVFKKLILTFLAIIILPVGFISWMVYYNSRNALEKEIFSRVNLMVDQEAAEIENFVSERKSDLSVLARRDVYKTPFFVFDTLNQFYRDTTSPFYIHAKNEIDRRFVLFQHAYKYVNVDLANMEGRVIYASDPQHNSEVGELLADRDDIFRKLKDGGIHVGEIRKIRGGDVPYLFYMTGPIYGDAETMIGLVRVGIDLSTLNKLLEESPELTGKSWEELLVRKTADNKVLYLSPLKYETGVVLTKSIALGAKEAIPAQNAVSGKSGSGLFPDYRGKEVLSAWRPISTLGWGLVVKIDKEEALLPIKKLFIFLIVVTLIIIFIATLSAFFMAKAIADPIQKLRRGTEIIGAGNLNYKVGVDTKDEVGQLSRAFDMMLGDLRKTTVSKDYLESIMTSMTDSLVVVDYDGKIVTTNIATCRLLGYEKEELIGKDVSMLPSDDEIFFKQDALKDLFNKGVLNNFETNYKTKSGKKVPVILSWALLKGIQCPKGVPSDDCPTFKQRGCHCEKIQGAVCVAKDITERKGAEIKNKLSLEEAAKAREIMVSIMEDNNTSRANLLKQAEELKITKDAAEAASRAKSQFLANMSHEIRTPMNSIIGFLDLLQYTELNAVQKDYVSTAMMGGNVLLSVVNDVLDISKIDAGGLVLEKIDFDLEYLLESALKIIMPKLQRGDVEFLFEFTPATPLHFKGDPTRIRQIVLNLISNAIKFTERGEIKVTVSMPEAQASDPKLRTVAISVKDTGIGIPPEKQGKIFELFTQADESTTRKFGGTGLGLSISKALAQKMGGDIMVHSQAGQGSEFVVTLQLQEGEPLAKKDITPVSILQLKDKKVAIVDDNENVIRLAEAYCKGYGMDVVFRTTLAEALLVWLNEQADPPAIILVDLMMPEMDGVALAKRIREDDKFKGIKLIAVTADVRPGAASDSQQAGFDAYLPKPIIRNELIGVIQAALGDKRKEKEIITRHMAGELSLKGVRVLVAEDKAVNQKLIKIYLDIFGCVSDYAATGEEAIEKMRTSEYDVCLMDIQMPGMGGLEATARIRKNISRDIPIIALTAGVMKEDKENVIAAGMNDYLSKPINHKKLKEMLSKWVSI